MTKKDKKMKIYIFLNKEAGKTIKKKKHLNCDFYNYQN